MAITILGVRPLDRQTSKLIVEGRPVSGSGELSISQVLEKYKRLADMRHDVLETVGDDELVADLPSDTAEKA